MIVYDHGEVKEWSMFHAHDLNTLRACILAARKIYQFCHRIIYLNILLLSLDFTMCTQKLPGVLSYHNNWLKYI